MSELDWGDVPTWTSTVVSAVALGAAWFAARASWKVLKIETERDNDADEREQRAQADLVAAWLDIYDLDDSAEWHVCLANESKVPIYDVDVVVKSAVYPNSLAHTSSVYSPVVPPGRTFLPFPEVPMHTYDEVERLAEDNDDPRPPEVDSVMDSEFGIRLLHKVSFTFSDAAGIKWERSRLGILTRVPPGGSNLRGDDLI